jgi:putative SOS response-associated peptidase YedK
MCGRFVIYATKDDVERVFHVVRFVSGYEKEFRPNFNVAPQQKIAVIADNEIKPMTWGMQLGKFNLINTRVESMEKPFFRKLEHCIILANGFYEWKDKQPMYITVKNRPIIALAGIYKDDACSIITTTPNDFMKDIHNRMPVILPKGKEDEWLKSSSLDILKPSDEHLQAIKVTPAVNSPKFNSPECIKAIN